jgi:hypothetical protein
MPPRINDRKYHDRSGNMQIMCATVRKANEPIKTYAAGSEGV